VCIQTYTTIENFLLFSLRSLLFSARLTHPRTLARVDSRPFDADNGDVIRWQGDRVALKIKTEFLYSETVMTWNIEAAQQQLAEVITAAEQEPQMIYQRDRLVAAIVKPELFQQFLAWQQQQHPPLADTFTHLRQLCIEEDYTLEAFPRQNRPNSFTESSA